MISSPESTSLYILGPDGASRVGEPAEPGTNVIAYNDELLMTANYDFRKNQTDLVVYRMLQQSKR